MSLDPDVVAQLNDNMRLMNDTMGVFLGTMGAVSQQAKNTTSTEKNLENSIRSAMSARQNLTKAELAGLEAQQKDNFIRGQQTKALRDSGEALKSFASAILNTERSFAKYNTTLENAGNAALELGRSFGLLGAIVGGILKGATMLASAFTKQADNVLKATDDLSKFGTAGQLTAEEIRKMGAKVGYTSEQLDKLVKPMQSIGSGLISLGGTAAEGAKAFTDIADIGQDQRMKYQRLGISQAELTQAQADYVRLQQISGNQIHKTNQQLQKSSLAYVDNLLTLASLTGQDIESIKKQKEIAVSEIETKIQNNLLDQQIYRLKKSGTEEDLKRAAQLEKEKEVRDKLLTGIQAEIGDPMLRRGLAKFFATGAITQEVAALKLIGVPIENFAAKLKKGEDVYPDFMDSLSKYGDAAVEQFGYTSLFSEETRKATNISSEMLDYLARTRGKEARLREQVIKDAMTTADTDPAQIARNKLTEMEISAALALDNLVASMNPLLTGFENMDIKLQALIIAVGAATAALVVMAGTSFVRGAGNLVGGMGGGAIGPRGQTLMRGAGYAGLGLGVGLASDYAADALGRDTKMGAGADILGSAASMAGTGAMVGSFFGPGLGTAIGAGVGGLLGTGYGLYQNWGTLFGGKEADENTPEARQRQSLEELLKLDQELQQSERQLRARSLNLGRMTNTEKILFERDSHLLNLQMAQNQEKLSLIEYENATDALAKQAAKERLDQAKKQIELSKYQMATINMQFDLDKEKKAEYGKEMMQAKLRLAHLEINRQKQILQTQIDQKLDLLKQEVDEKEKEKLEKEIETLKNQIDKITDDIRKSFEEEAADIAGVSGAEKLDFSDPPAPAETSPDTPPGVSNVTSPGSSQSSTSRYGYGGYWGKVGRALTGGMFFNEPPPDYDESENKEGTSVKPDNVKIGPNADISGLDSKLLESFYGAAQEFGKPVTITSAKRSDEKQAELFVRGNILKEPGIYMPSRPKDTTTIFYQGKKYTVNGTGRGSKHRDGDAIDISADYSELDPILKQYGLHRPHLPKDPPHVEKIQARDGGLVSGPNSGYPATLHGNEIIVPLDPNSILAELGKKSQTQIQSEILEKTSRLQSTNPEVFNQIASINQSMMEMLSQKLDNMIDKLDTSNDIQDKLLKYSQV